MKAIALALPLILFCTPAAAAAVKNWSVRIGTDGNHQRATCLLESMTRRVHDGQTTTPVRLVYSGEAIMGMTRSNIDLSYAGVGLQVDDRAVHGIDAVQKKTNVVFNKATAKLLQEFIKGRQASLTLGFWPTWPKTGTVTSRFSLHGFHAAYRDFQYCQQTGELKK